MEIRCADQVPQAQEDRCCFPARRVADEKECGFLCGRNSQTRVRSQDSREGSEELRLMMLQRQILPSTQTVRLKL